MEKLSSYSTTPENAPAKASGQEWPWAIAIASVSAQPPGPRPLLWALPAALGCSIAGSFMEVGQGSQGGASASGPGTVDSSWPDAILRTENSSAYRSGARAQGSQAGQMGEGCLLEAA